MLGLSTGHLIVLVIAGLVIFGPERLPKVAQDAGRMLRQLRRMADDVRNDLKEELGPELADLDLASLHPKALVKKHLLDPSLDEVRDAGLDKASLQDLLRDHDERGTPSSADVSATHPGSPLVGLTKLAAPAEVPSSSSAVQAPTEAYDYSDAT